MKVLALVCLVGVTKAVLGAAIPLEDESERIKRSGDLISYIGSKVHSKISSIASASSSLSSHDQHDSHHVEYETPASYGHKSFDLWSFKKAILNTLLQAVKAIKGGIIALKGQLIKAKGHILQTKGRIISAKGEAITDFGRHIATKALLSSHSHGHSAPSGPNAGYSSHSVEASGPAYVPPSSGSYGPPPSAPGDHYGGQFKLSRATTGQQNPNDSKDSGLPGGVQAGLLILKPITQPPKQQAGAPYVTYHDAFGSHSQPADSTIQAPQDAGIEIHKSLDYSPFSSIFGY